MKEFDYVVVGSGLFGSVFAHEMTKKGKKCLVIDKRNHLGGNTYCKSIRDINVHLYGAHIFHTNDEFIWKYVNSFVPFNHYVNSPLAINNGKIYNLPFNMNTFYQLWNVKTPEEAKSIIAEQTRLFKNCKPRNLEEQALAIVGKDIYECLVRDYSEKQWGKSATDLPASIIKRIPLRFTFDNNYFSDKFQGIPIGGYNKLIMGLLKDIEVRLGVDFIKNRIELEAICDKIVYSGKIDEYYNQCFGELEYRSLRFEHTELHSSNFQGNAVINYTSKEIPYTRIIEHKHFEFGTQPDTVITREFPQQYSKDTEAYYPINDQKNSKIYDKYKALSLKDEKTIFGGRLAEFKYYDMHQVIASAFTKVKQCTN